MLDKNSNVICDNDDDDEKYDEAKQDMTRTYGQKSTHNRSIA